MPIYRLICLIMSICAGVIVFFALQYTKLLLLLLIIPIAINIYAFTKLV